MATQDNLRCARCYMVVHEVFSKIMQELLEHRTLTALEVYDFVMNRPQFLKTLNDREDESLRTLRTDGFSKLDVSIIYKTVRHFRNKMFIPMPTDDWGVKPSPNNKDIGDDVERIHSARNHFAHKPNSDTSETEFEEFFDEFYYVGQRVDKYLRKNPTHGFARRIRDLKNAPMDTESIEKYLEARQEIEQLKQELVIQENRKEIVIFVGRDVDDTIIKLRELKDLEENSSSSIKITIDGVVDSDAQLKKLENALDELSVESEMKVKSVERNCIELVVEIDNCYFKDKQKLLQAVLKFFTCLQEKQAFKWKGNKVTIVITIDEGFDEQDIMEEDKGNTSLVVENTKHFELEKNPKSKSSLILNLEMKSADLRDGKLNQQLTTFVQNLLKKSNGRELFEETHVNASLVVGDTWNSEEADNEALLELADQHINNGKQQRAKTTIAKLLARLDKEFNVTKGSKRTDLSEIMNACHTKRIGKQYKKCSLLLMKISGGVFDALRSYYTGLVCCGNPDLYEHEKLSSHIWKTIQAVGIHNLKMMGELVQICDDLYESHTQIILFMAVDIAVNFVQLISKLPEHSKIDLYTLVRRCWLICARCHYILKEFNKALEVLNLFFKDKRQCNNIDVLELRIRCLMHTEKYTMAKQNVDLAMQFASSEEQRSKLQKLKRQINESDNIQTDENYDSENTSSKDSGYSYFSHIDLVEFTNIDSKATFEVRSIADSQYSASSSVSTKSHRQKVRRKTKSLRNKKHLPMQNLPVCQSSKNDVIINWIDDCFQSMTSDQYQRAETAENIEDLNLNSNQGNQEIRYCEGDNLSENMSDVSTCTLSLTGVSADEFSGSEYDISVSDCDWYSLGSDIEEESVYNEENISEEQTYYERSILYHSGEIKARNILEEEYFQKGLDLNDEWVESVGSQYFKRKNNIYNEILNKNFHQECYRYPRIYKKCNISIESAHQAICKPVETKDEIQEIYIAGRSKCGQTFTDDTVVVKIYSKQYLGKVHGEVVSLLDRHRYKDMKHPVFVCLLDWKEGYLMKTLCRTVPKLHVLHSKVDERFNKSRVEIYNYDAINGILNFSHFHDVQEGEREQWLFIVAFIKWKPNRIYPLAAVIGVIHCSQNPYDGIRIMSKEHQVPYFYQKSTVEGTQAAVEKNRAFDVTNYIDRSNTLRIFTIDPPGSKDLDDAFSVMMRIDGSYVVGIHITDVTTIVKKDDLVDIEAKARCVTFYPGKGFRPFAMLPEPLSERICSLLPNQKRPVISVYFKFNSKGELAVTEPTIQKSIIRSCKQFTYQEVQNILDDKLEKQQIELLHDVKMLYKLSKRLKENRLGHASFSLPVEIDVSCDENLIDTYQAHSLVEEFMILTNHSIAVLLRRHYPKSVPLYCQQSPGNEVLANWYNMNHHYIHHVLGLQLIQTPKGKISVFHSPNEGRNRKLTPVQTWVLEEIKELVPDTEENIFRIKQLIQSDFLHPKQALAYHEWNLLQESSRYVSSSEISTAKDTDLHFSLRKRSYVHFTSPLRRYNDLVVHRLVIAMMKKEQNPPYVSHEISELCFSLNGATKRALQFNHGCKQFIFGRFLKSNPVLFNGFVKEISDNGIKVVIPGLQNLTVSGKEIQFKLLDVACKPEKDDDVEMLSMTEHEKERKMIVVKWEKRLYSYTHRACLRPKNSRFQPGKKTFSPYLRIYPHQNTTFLRYTDHWIKILKFVLENKIDDLRNLLSKFIDDEQTQVNILYDKDTISSFKRSVTDVSSEVKQGIIVEHRCRFQVPFHHGQIIQIQMSASMNRGFLTPSPQILDVTENIKFCIDHFDNPIKTLLRYAKLHTKPKYSSVDDYIRTWIPIVEMESTINAVHNEDTAVINDIPVEFRGRKGRFVLTKGFCDVRDMDFSDDDIAILSAGIIDGIENIKVDCSTNAEHSYRTKVGRIPTSTTDESDTDEQISNSEQASIDTKKSKIKSFISPKKKFIDPDLETGVTGKKSKDDSSQKMKPKYSKFLSPHFLCIKLKRPLTENVKSKIGKCLPNRSQYIWVAHGELLKCRKIKTKKFSKRRGCDKKVIEIDIVFKLHEESSFPPVKEVTSDDKCSIELILKSKAFRRIESYIKLLGQASELSQTIALGNQIKDLEQDHLRLCRTMNYDVDIPGFPSNNTQQYTAIKKALHSRFSLIQGPPGTGKTFTGVKLVYLFNKLNKLYEEKNGKRRRIIFCGPSNKSVDLVARWVVNKLGDKAPKIVRMYASAYEYLDFPVPGRAIISSRSMRDAKSDVALNKNGMVLHHIIRSNGKPHAAQIQKFDKKFHADNLIIQENEKLPHDQRKPVKTRLQDIYEYKCLLHTATVEELDNYDVIFCTTSLAGNPRLLTATKNQVAQVIIDECGMCSEPESMVPIIATHATQVVLIGDHKQLRPIIMSREASELGLEKSLFERYSTDRSLMTMLEQQYRMNASICEFPSRMFYDGKLKTAHEKIGKPLKPLMMWQKSYGFPRVFCHVEGEEETLTVKTKEGNEQSKSNKKEIEQVLKVFRHMVTVEGVNPETINVMSQYNAQCTALRDELTKSFNKVNVTTVVSSQGGEWDYVIFSLVRSLPKYMIEKNSTQGWCIQNLGFITDRHQINVALTRAKKGLVIIGNKNLLVGDEVWRKLLENYDMNDCIFDAHQFP